jgi:hypothetical protein
VGDEFTAVSPEQGINSTARLATGFRGQSMPATYCPSYREMHAQQEVTEEAEKGSFRCFLGFLCDLLLMNSTLPTGSYQIVLP